MYQSFLYNELFLRTLIELNLGFMVSGDYNLLVCTTVNFDWQFIV